MKKKFINWSKEKGFNPWELGITILITIIVFLWGLFSYFLDDDLGINGLGDFFAGIFTPIAFYWLIRGYMLQKQELQQNTKALELQAAELKNTVEEYKHMVEVNKQQLKLYKREFFQPKIQVSLSLSTDLYSCSFNIQLLNNGNDARNIYIHFGHMSFSIPHLAPSQTYIKTHNIEFNDISNITYPYKAIIQYQDANKFLYQLTQIIDTDDYLRKCASDSDL